MSLPLLEDVQAWLSECDDTETAARELAQAVAAAGLDELHLQEYRALLKTHGRLSGRAFDAFVAEARRAERATRRQRAGGGAGEGPELPNPAAPMWVADKLRELLPTEWAWWRGDFYRYAGSHWTVMEDSVVRGWLYRQTKDAWYWAEGRDGEPVAKAWMPNTSKVNGLADALGVGVLQRYGDADPSIAVRNGVLNLETRELLPHTPERFNLHALPFDMVRDADCPAWLAFLESVLPGDVQAHAFLAEWFGYIISGRTDMQKMLSLVGPPRCGKGTIARVLESLLGKEAVASPTLDKLPTQFGEQALIGKRLAIMSDVRWNGRNAADAVPVLLAIIGEDSRDVARKNREDWHGKLDARFMCMSNDVPTFRDASGALASRMIHVEFHTSFLGREDITLTRRLLDELPGILNWALAGLERLTERGHFITPESGRELDREVQEASSPFLEFVRSDWVELVPGELADMPAVMEAYLGWCKERRRTLDNPTESSLSRGLRSAVREITTGGRGTVDGRKVTRLSGLRVLRTKPTGASWIVGS